MYKLASSLLYISFFMANGCTLIQPKTVEEKLIGIWAMEPSQQPERGIANVVQYTSEGNYKLHSYTCTIDGLYEQNAKENEAGTWRIEDNTIIRTITDSRNKRELLAMIKEIKDKLSGMSEFERKAALIMLGPEKTKLLDGGALENKEKIISIEGDIMVSEEVWLMGMKILTTSHRVKEIAPLCDEH